MKVAKWRAIGIAFYAVGVAVPFFLSGGKGMPVTAHPAATIWWVVAWAAAFIFFYHGYIAARPQIHEGSLLWRRISNYISDYTSLFLLSAFLTAASFYPSGLAIGLPAKQMTFVSITLLIMGIGIPLDEWKRILKKPIPIFQLWIVRWVCMPLLALFFAVVFFSNFIADEEIATQLIAAQVLVGTTTTGGASNVYTFIVGGDAPLSILTTALSTLTDPLIQPGAARLLIGAMIDVPVVSMMLDLVKGVILPLVVGVIISSFLLKNKVKRFAPLFSAVSVIFMFPLFLGAFCGGWATLLQNLYIVPILLVVDVLHACSGCAIGYFLPGKIFGFNEAQRRASLFEVGVENVSITSALAFSYFGPLAATAAMLYGLTQTMIVMVVINLFKSKDRKSGKNPQEGGPADEARRNENIVKEG
jgi:BASS family bile acid:Na+ symporter